MSTPTCSPKLVKGGLVVLDGATGAVRCTIALQYNPERAQSFRFKGPAVETIKIEVEIERAVFLSKPA